jgi:hypothetical protein
MSGSIAYAQAPAGQSAANWGQVGTTYALHSNAGSGIVRLMGSPVLSRAGPQVRVRE